MGRMVVLDGANRTRDAAEDDGQLVVSILSGSGCDGADAVGSGKPVHDIRVADRNKRLRRELR